VEEVHPHAIRLRWRDGEIEWQQWVKEKGEEEPSGASPRGIKGWLGACSKIRGVTLPKKPERRGRGDKGGFSGNTRTSERSFRKGNQGEKSDAQATKRRGPSDVSGGEGTLVTRSPIFRGGLKRSGICQMRGLIAEIRRLKRVVGGWGNEKDVIGQHWGKRGSCVRLGLSEQEDQKEDR